MSSCCRAVVLSCCRAVLRSSVPPVQFCLHSSFIVFTHPWNVNDKELKNRSPWYRKLVKKNGEADIPPPRDEPTIDSPFICQPPTARTWYWGISSPEWPD